MKYILLFENFNQANSILTKLGKDQTDENFQKINSFVKTKGYIGLFTKLFFIDNIPLNRLEHLSMRLDRLKMILPQLKQISGKNVDEYINLKDEKISTIEKLEDDLTRLEEDQAKKKIYNELPKSWKEELLNTTDEKRKTFDNLSKSLGNSTEYKNLFRKLARLNNIDQLISEMEELLDKIKGGLDYDSIKKKIEEIDEEEGLAYIVYDRNNILVAHINEYKASKLLGSESWCISSDQEYWNQYVNDEDSDGFLQNDIYFIWDFNKKSSDDNHQIGTVRRYKGFGATHDMKDNSIDIKTLPYFKDIEFSLETTIDSSRIEEALNNMEPNDDNISFFIRFGEPEHLKEFFDDDYESNRYFIGSNINTFLSYAIDYENIPNLIYLLDFIIKYDLNFDEAKLVYSNYNNEKIINILIDKINEKYSGDEGYGDQIYLSALIKKNDDSKYDFKIDEILNKLHRKYPDIKLYYIPFIPNLNFIHSLQKYKLDNSIKIRKFEENYFSIESILNNKTNNNEFYDWLFNKFNYLFDKITIIRLFKYFKYDKVKYFIDKLDIKKYFPEFKDKTNEDIYLKIRIMKI